MFARLIAAIFKDRSGYVGRKLVAAWAVTLLATFVLMVHVIVNLLVVPVQHIEPLISSDTWQLILIAVWGTFFASDSVNLWTFNVRKDVNQPSTNSGRTGEALDGSGAETERAPSNAE